MPDEPGPLGLIDRRALLRKTAGATVGLGALGALGAPAAGAGAPSAVRRRSRAIVGDVVRYALSSDAWEGEFGFVVMRLHRADVDGQEAYFIRTDTSDRAYAREQRLVWAPKIGTLKAPGLSGGRYTVEGGTPDQQIVLSSEPGRPDYTPAWLVHRVRWTGARCRLTSVARIEAARNAGELTVTRPRSSSNAAVVKWSAGELAVDGRLRSYHGGQLIERPNTNAMTVMFKLHQCYPGSRYIVTDHSLEGPAEANQDDLRAAAAGRPHEGRRDRPRQPVPERAEGGRAVRLPALGLRLARGHTGVEPVLGSLRLPVAPGRRRTAAAQRGRDQRRASPRRPTPLRRRSRHERHSVHRQLPGPGDRAHHLSRAPPRASRLSGAERTCRGAS